MKSSPLIFLGDDLGGGGAERAMVEVIRWLCRARPEVTVRLLLLKKSGVFLDAIPPGVRIDTIGGHGPYLVRNAVRAIALARCLRQHSGATLVSFMNHMNQLALLAARCAPGVRVFGVEQCAVGVSHATGCLRQVGTMERRRLRFLYRRAERIVVASTGLRDEIAGLIAPDRDRCVVIPNPVDVPRRAAPAVDRRFRFLFSGRLVEQKNPRLLLRAFAETRRRVNEADVTLRIVGDGSLRGELTALAGSLGIAEAIEWTGFLKEPWSAMAPCQALVLPSNFEGFGNVLVEALALGMPAVATDCPHGPRDILGSDSRLGLLVPPGDLESLAGAMIRLVRERKVWKESRLFREEHARRFSIETIGPLYEKLLLP